jgi:hypothetical protein
MADQFAGFSKPRPASATRHVSVASGSGTLTDVPDAWICLTAGTLTLTDSAATAIAYPMTAGQQLPLRMAQYSVGSGTYAAVYL